MLKPKQNLNMKIKNKLLPEIDSDINRFKHLQYSKTSSKNNEFKRNNSYISSDENNDYNENENQKYISILNDVEKLSINNSASNNTKKSPLTEFKTKNKDPYFVYKEIKSYIKQFLAEYVNEKTSIYFVLKEILNATIIIIKDFIDNNNSSLIENNPNLFVTEDEGSNNEKKNFNLDINSKIVFLLKIQKLNNTIKKLKEEQAFFKSIVEVPNTKLGNNFIDLFKKKYMEQKAKNKKEELNYLLCIGEQEKEINSLKKEISKNVKENLPIEISKSLRCFPNFHQYDFKEDINPKSIPLFQQFQKEKKIDKYLRKDIIKSPKNDLSNSSKRKTNIFNNNSSNDRTKLLLTNPDFKRVKKNNKENFFKSRDNKVVSLNKINIYNMSLINDNNVNKERNEFYKVGSNQKVKILNTESNIIKKKEENQRKINAYFKDYFPKTIIDNKKEFFLAHPTLSIAGVVKNKELKYIGLPKKIIRLKFHKNVEKNILVTFPSSLNETLVNLEKLRKRKFVNNEK